MMIDLYSDMWVCEDFPVDVKEREIFFITAQSAGFTITEHLRDPVFSDHTRIASFGLQGIDPDEPSIEALLITHISHMEVIPFHILMRLMRRAVKKRKTN